MRKIGKTYGEFLLPFVHAGNGIRNTVSHLQSNFRHLTALTRYPKTTICEFDMDEMHARNRST